MKIGGSLITYKNRWVPSINEENLKRIGKEIGNALKKRKEELLLILIHGAGSYGHTLATLYNFLKDKDKKKILGFAEIQRLQNELNTIVCSFLQNYDIPATPLQPSSSAVMNSGKLISLDVSTIKGMLEIGLVPVLYGVPAYDKKLGTSILSGDEIIKYLAKKLRPDRLIHVTDVDGVYDKDPKIYSNAKLIKEINRKNFSQFKEILSTSVHFDVTGGMMKKVKELIELEGITAEIINGLKNGYVERVLLGEIGLGTLIRG